MSRRNGWVDNSTASQEIQLISVGTTLSVKYSVVLFKFWFEFLESSISRLLIKAIAPLTAIMEEITKTPLGISVNQFTNHYIIDNIINFFITLMFYEDRKMILFFLNKKNRLI